MTAWYHTAFILLGLALAALRAQGAGSGSHQTAFWYTQAQAELESQYPGAKIEWQSQARVVRGQVPAVISRVILTQDTGRGEAVFTLQGESEAEVVIGFAAQITGLYPRRRIQPGEKLSQDLFVQRPINVSMGMAREMRGVVLRPDTDMSKLESRQTLLEGQFVVSTAVQKVPDVRRGEVVKVRLISGDIELLTSGTADEPSQFDQLLRITTIKSKRTLMGRLQADGSVEVRL